MKKLKEKAYPGLSVSKEEWELFASKFTYKEFPKKSIITKQGETENYLSFLVKGAVRSFIKKNEKETTLRFHFSDSFFSAYPSFMMQKPSEFALESLTDCSCWQISYENLQKCYNETAGCGHRMGRISAEFLYIKSITREISMLTESAEERYITLMEKNPEIIQNIPLKYIASYLGITPQALSRIRARIF
ncbi:MAG: Crp/Fnr family transcriptional regulator [Cruoricaptor ignavus]|nr:Crp/Fnr family transcriptional regulator [Cruoricaptor ignavus]